MRARRKISSLAAGTLCSLLLLACGGEPSPELFGVDSAGVRISLSPYHSGLFAGVDTTPTVSIGGPEALGPEQFFRIVDLHVDPAGRLWVADLQSSEIRIFLRDGSHWKTLGGRGEGPGEFMRVSILGSFAGDSVAAWDDGLGRLTVFDSNGEIVRAWTVRGSDGGPTRPADVFPDGSLLSRVPRILPASAVQRGQTLGDSLHLVRLSPVDSAETFIAGAPGPVWLWTGRSQLALPFTTNPGYDLVGEGLLLVHGPDFRVRVFEGSRLVTILGVDRSPRPVSDSHRAAYRSFVEETVPERGREDVLATLDHPELPDQLPGYGGVLAAADGTVWAKVYTPDPLASETWEVFDLGGEFLGQVRPPRGFRLMAIAEDGLAGVWRDELGVEYVRVYRLNRHPDRS
ncbi:MAG: hypothetical protein PVJ76_05415 [Gemmatimonadota bacterium]